MRLSELSIRAALVSVVCIAITPALGIIIWSGLEQNKLMEIQTKQEVMNKTEAFAEIQVRITDSTYQLLALLAALPEFQNQQWEAMEKTLKAIHSRNDDYLNITATDEAGIVTVSSLLPVGTDLHARPHVAQALKTKNFSPGEYIVSLVESTPSFPYSFPIINEAGMLRGTINGIYKLSSYQYIFDQLMVPVNSILGFVDRHGQRLFYYPENMVTNPIGVRIKQDVWKNAGRSRSGGFYRPGLRWD